MAEKVAYTEGFLKSTNPLSLQRKTFTYMQAQNNEKCHPRAILSTVKLATFAPETPLKPFSCCFTTCVSPSGGNFHLK